MKCFFSRSAWFAFWLLVATLSAWAQTPAPENFDDLARSAEAVLDSNPAQAAALYKKALDLRPAWPEGWFYLGGALYRLARYAEALDAFQKGTALSPANGAAWGFTGLCEYELGHFEKALSDIDKGERLGLGSNTGFETAVRQCAALILIRASLFDKAMAQMQPLTKYHVDSPAVIELVGLCALAEPHLPAELPEKRQTVAAMAGKALWSATSQHPKEAEEGYQQLLAAYPNEPGVHYAHGLYLMDVDQNAALAEFQKEIAANPAHWPSLLVSAFLETRQGTPELAIRSAQQASKLAPASYRWLCDAETGRALLNMDQAEKSIPLFEESIKLQPDNAQTHFYLEQAYRRAGRKADAQREKAEFVRLKAVEDPLSLPGLVNSTQR
ncbi:MAG: tetratricopeptide repeat protein [Bryobacteraceae bacterium]|jgi:tetratricopeptide (TPR) repeat protein